MEINFTITKIECPYCGKCDGTTIEDRDYAPGELSNVLPNEVTCNECNKQFTVSTSLIISIDKTEEPEKQDIPTLCDCNDCGKMTTPPNCEHCGSFRLTPAMI